MHDDCSSMDEGMSACQIVKHGIRPMWGLWQRDNAVSCTSNAARLCQQSGKADNPLHDGGRISGSIPYHAPHVAPRLKNPLHMHTNETLALLKGSAIRRVPV